jgi:hypothetical protein
MSLVERIAGLGHDISRIIDVKNHLKTYFPPYY